MENHLEIYCKSQMNVFAFASNVDISPPLWLCTLYNIYILGNWKYMHSDLQTQKWVLTCYIQVNFYCAPISESVF